MRRLLLCLSVLALLVGGTVTATAEPSDTGRPVVDCGSLVRDYDLPGTRAHVTSATPVTDGIAHCDVRGHVDDKVRFQLRLPTAGYSGRYVQYGCGGLCGELYAPEFPERCGPRPGDAAVASTDDGHVGTGATPFFDATWAANDQKARDDWQFRAPHVTSLASKAVIKAFYGAGPRQSYFTGCSNGGQEALLLAQRYPHDFDGIVSAAPGAYFGALVLYEAWLTRVNTDAAGGSVLTAPKLPVLHEAVLARCDGIDGLVDRQLDDPRRCDFDPGTLRCATGDAPTCLTDAQVDTARKLYAGPTDAAGVRLYPGNEAYGSELAWYGWIVPAPEYGEAFARTLADNYLRYAGYPIGTPHSSVDAVPFTQAELRRIGVEGARGNAMSLDLSEFRRSGGKLVLWHGWNDQAIPADSTLDYYERLTRTSGGPAATRRWARLFAVPAMYHCFGGTTLTEFDPLKELFSWVEQDRAPERVVATGRDGDGNVVRTRPVFPYPLTARYDGSGSTDEAANFVPALPAKRPKDAIDWAGTYLHHVPGPVAP
ncbi:tannase/feruloyl esterase family alpha/beta hydrolase [Saccharothrix violaceirubra]|uniref:Feruloyl esterase n=1 Tax=Saccharothrix violaceirubra TaxID=413306 RepID=A0A7W7T1G3_9PSEU|nr:tannase/feruloyl esterase family alpha/beta hydrolase [Saccharothrix violaceirubra]MBB4964829.1 feruloyl esterase [Saccharothrix violaceirubra]